MLKQATDERDTTKVEFCLSYWKCNMPSKLLIYTRRAIMDKKGLVQKENRCKRKQSLFFLLDTSEIITASVNNFSNIFI